MKTTLVIIGVVMLLLAGIIGYNIAKNFSDDLGDARWTNVFRVDDDNNVMVKSQVAGTEIAVTSDGAAATSTGGSLPADTYYFKFTNVDADGGQTMPSSEFNCSIGTEGVATSTGCTVTHTTIFGTVSRLWISTVSGTFTEYRTATSSVLVATTTGLTTAVIPTTMGAAYDSADTKYSYNASSTPGDIVIKATSGTLHSLTVNTTSAGAITIYDGVTCAGTVIAVIKASVLEKTFTYDVSFNTGLCVTLASTSDITVSYR